MQQATRFASKTHQKSPMTFQHSQECENVDNIDCEKIRTSKNSSC